MSLHLHCIYSLLFAPFLHRIFDPLYDPKCPQMEPNDTLSGFATRLTKMSRYKELASVIKNYVQKYEKAKFSPQEMLEEDFEQV